MRPHQASFTARAVALARALAWRERHGAPAALDPTAAVLLGLPRLGNLAPWRPFAASRLAARALTLASLGVFDHVAVRTLVIDEALIAACAAGIDQIAILGAGLDGRAWRLPELARATVFEVDHPATQRIKRQRASALTACAAGVRFVAVNFERDSLASRLAQSGHDATRPTAWLWEGVTMYLEPDTVARTLRELARLSATSSRLIASYATGDSWLFRLRIGGAVARAFAAIGEPAVGITTRARFHSDARQAGWIAIDDASPAEVRRRYPGGWARPPFEERIITCRL